MRIVNWILLTGLLAAPLYPLDQRPPADQKKTDSTKSAQQNQPSQQNQQKQYPDAGTRIDRKESRMNRRDREIDQRLKARKR